MTGFRIGRPADEPRRLWADGEESAGEETRREHGRRWLRSYRLALAGVLAVVLFAAFATVGGLSATAGAAHNAVNAGTSKFGGGKDKDDDKAKAQKRKKKDDDDGDEDEDDDDEPGEDQYKEQRKQCKKAVKEQEKAFKRQQEQEEEAFEDQQRAEHTAFHATNPTKAQHKAFHAQQEQEEDAFEAQQKAEAKQKKQEFKEAKKQCNQIGRNQPDDDDD